MKLPVKFTLLGGFFYVVLCGFVPLPITLPDFEQPQQIDPIKRHIASGLISMNAAGDFARNQHPEFVADMLRSADIVSRSA